jgi:hypothetical protein
MPATPPCITSNAQRRALILTQVEARLQEIWPDELLKGQRTFADFDALEAVATRAGDTLARTLMEEGLREVMPLLAEERLEYCAKCGRKLQWSEQPHSLQTIRGPVQLKRDYGYCRACERGFFPLRGALSVGRTSAKCTLAAGAQRTRQRC